MGGKSGGLLISSDIVFSNLNRALSRTQLSGTRGLIQNGLQNNVDYSIVHLLDDIGAFEDFPSVNNEPAISAAEARDAYLQARRRAPQWFLDAVQTAVFEAVLGDVSVTASRILTTDRFGLAVEEEHPGHITVKMTLGTTDRS